MPVTTPSQPQCKLTYLYRSASAPGWHAHFDHVHRHRPVGQPISITGQPATPTTNNLASPTLVVFTARRSYTSAVLGVVFLSVRPSVRLSVRHTRAL